MSSETTSTGVRVCEVVIPARDGLPLAGRVYGEGSSAVVIAGAMGVPQRFYRRFAEWLAGNGLRVVSFDWRGIGESALPSGAPVGLGIWAEQDLEGVLNWVRNRLGAERVAVVGHSLGGQLVPLAEASSELTAGYLVASQSGHWRHWDGAWRLRMFAIWHLLLPASTAVLGKLPAQLLGGSGEDVPAAVADEWARWGRHRDYVLSHQPDTRERFARLTLPICMVRIADDPLAPRRAVDALASYYTGATIERRLLDPAELGGGAIGHFGFFRQRHGELLWPHALAFLRLHLSAPAHVDAALV
jgi:predicted alpha/beta hydrolase